ncbi:MAG: GFA family protein [Pseudomonadota bacterium]|nr:GFA family protein [Pseudomonadota bacterium]
MSGDDGKSAVQDGAAEPAGWALPWAGGCRCGALRFAVTAPPLISVACHCRGCQRMTGGAFSLTLCLPVDGFAVTKGETRRVGMGAAPWAGPESQALDHRGCAVCGGWAFTRVADVPDMVTLRATLLDDAGWIRPFAETGMAHGLPWAVGMAEHGFDDFPPADAWGPLIADHAARGARPSRAG